MIKFYFDDHSCQQWFEHDYWIYWYWIDELPPEAECVFGMDDCKFTLIGWKDID